MSDASVIKILEQCPEKFGNVALWSPPERIAFASQLPFLLTKSGVSSVHRPSWMIATGNGTSQEECDCHISLEAVRCMIEKGKYLASITYRTFQ
jgi:hypothetical protein